MMSGRKKRNTGATAGHDSDRKRLTSREVKKLIESAKGSRP
jgi:hypothetical protein